MRLDYTLTAVRRPVSTLGFPVRAALALLASLVGNAVLLAIAQSLSVAPDFDPLAYPPVLFLTTVGTLGAAVVYWLLTRFVERPEVTFTRVVVAVLVLSFVPDFALLVYDPTATILGVVVLMLMHAVVAVACVALFPANRV
ncbi:DUF6069 family protein [Haloarchaeobius sp. DFWS5]|uniref:DUF6069 family protein n=1 Tax=Haloarchaeobius sp. DFWS5 TaxID=3446114 RepID=UPI003EB9E946